VWTWPLVLLQSGRFGPVWRGVRERFRWEGIAVGKHHLLSCQVAKEQDSNKDNHRPHRVTPVLLVLWTTIGHGNGVDGAVVRKI
jgi:hypothetical protein